MIPFRRRFVSAVHGEVKSLLQVGHSGRWGNQTVTISHPVEHNNVLLTDLESLRPLEGLIIIWHGAQVFVDEKYILIKANSLGQPNVKKI